MSFNSLQVASDPTRQEILRLVWTAERSAGDIAERVPVTFGAVSQHLGILRKAGMVTVRQDGRHRYYIANRDALGSLTLAEHLESIWRYHLGTLKVLAEQAETEKAQAMKRKRR